MKLTRLLDTHRPERVGLCVEDIQNLCHANGVGRHVERERWGYRNSFVPGLSDRSSIDRLVAAGLMESRPAPYPEGAVFVTTEAGRALLGLPGGEQARGKGSETEGRPHETQSTEQGVSVTAVNPASSVTPASESAAPCRHCGQTGHHELMFDPATGSPLKPHCYSVWAPDRILWVCPGYEPEEA